jgi:hypothetical protein
MSTTEAVTVIGDVISAKTIALPDDVHRLAVSVATQLAKQGLLLDPDDVELARALAARVLADRGSLEGDAEALAELIAPLTNGYAAVNPAAV